jgi:hypothetical protein
MSKQTRCHFIASCEYIIYKLKKDLSNTKSVEASDFALSKM